MVSLRLVLVLLLLACAVAAFGQEPGFDRELPTAEDFRLLNVAVGGDVLDGRSALRMAGDEAVLASVAAQRRELMQELRARGERPGPQAFEATRHGAAGAFDMWPVPCATAQPPGLSCGSRDDRPVPCARAQPRGCARS